MELKVVQTPWYAHGLKFECTSCGNCCTGGPGFIWISDPEIARLSDFLLLPADHILRQYCRKLQGGISLKEKPRNSRGEYDCIFLQELPAEPGDGNSVRHSRRICQIYPLRPLQCRTWPFWQGNLASPKAWQAATVRCPGMNQGKAWPLDQIEARRDAADWPDDRYREP